MFSEVVADICRARAPIITNCLPSGPASDPVEFHIYEFEASACKVVGYNPKCSRVVVLLVCMGVEGCLCPISLRV